VAEDELMVRNLTGNVLKQLGYNVLLTEDGLQAVEAFKTTSLPFDLVILDLTMPNLSGHDAMKQIRELDPNVPVILASGYSAERSRVKAPNVQFLDKPFSPSDLGKVVSQLLQRNKS
jgi:two-component system, cell cycle sensor histidine kinase and response regulator CckA